MPKAPRGATTLSGLGYEWQRSTAATRTAAVGTRCPGIPGRRCGVVMTSGSTSKRAATVDHIIPRARGGTNDEWNRRVLCRSCNASLGAVIGNKSPKRRVLRQRRRVFKALPASKLW